MRAFQLERHPVNAKQVEVLVKDLGLVASILDVVEHFLVPDAVESPMHDSMRTLMQEAKERLGEVRAELRGEL